MIALSMKSNIDQVLRQFGRDAANIPLATAKALTFTAERVRDAERKEMVAIFDRPTPFTLNSLYLRAATPARLEARVWFKELRFREHYLVPQVHGGERPLKRFEKYLQQNGFLPVGMQIVPGDRAQLDSYGNINRGQIVQILSALRTLPQAGYLANRSAASTARRAKSKKPRALVNYFVGRPKPSAPLGVWERVPNTNGLRPILMFVRSARYQPRFKFYEIAKAVSEREFMPLFERELRRPAPAMRIAA